LNDEEESDSEDDMFDELQSDPSKAELLMLCQALNQLFITLKFKKIDLADAQGDLSLVPNQLLK
jgi:hypothetical protein